MNTTNIITALRAIVAPGSTHLDVRLSRADIVALLEHIDMLTRVTSGYSDVISNHCIAMQAAVIDADLNGHQAGMRWIWNTLAGPGLLPDFDEAKAIGGAQAWFDRATAVQEARKASINGGSHEQ
jgi:hypothetical protein